MVAGIEAATGAGLPGNWSSGQAGGANAFFDWFLKNIISPVVIDARNNDCPLLGLLYKNTMPFAGKFLIEGVRDGRNMSGISAVHNGGNLPDPGQQGGLSYSVGTRDIYARVKIDGKLLARAMKEGGAMLQPLAYETEGIADDLRIKQEIYMHGDGSGRRAQASGAAPASTVCTVKHNQDNEGVANVTTRATIHLLPGMRVGFITPDGVTLRGSAAFYVKAITGDNTISLSTTLNGTAIASLAATIGYSDNDWIIEMSRDASFSSPVWLDSGWRNEPMGFEGIFRDIGVLDGNGISTAGQQTGANYYGNAAATADVVGFQGIPVNSSPANYNYDPPTWNKAIVLDAAGGSPRPIGDALLQQALSDFEERNGGVARRLISAWSIYNAYVQTLIGDKRFNSTKLEGGHTGGITFNGIEWFKSRFMCNNSVTFLDEQMFKIFENQPLAPVDALGTTTWQQMKDKHAFSMAMWTSYNMKVDLRERAGARLVDVY